MRNLWIAIIAAASLLGARAVPADDLSSRIQRLPDTQVAVDPLVAPVAFLSEQCCEPSCRDDWSLFAGLEGSKQPQDFGVNAHFGARVAVNYGRLISSNSGLGLQVGTAVVATDNAVQVVERVEGSSSRLQSFTTLGLFQHTDSGVHWTIVYDLLWQDSYDDFFLGQWRGDLGYDLGCSDRAGVMAMLHGHGDAGSFGAAGVYLRPINQASLYWRHTWPTGGSVRGWLGLADGHAEVNAALGDWPRRDTMVVFGSDFRVPLTDFLSLTGQANFITPADTGTVDAFLGFEYFPGGRSAAGRAARPLLPVASNATFSVDMFR
ncbi:hypothetical protein KOR34_45740 [Posidoniimonas corsicana]|uniref:Uncharacterized protein n=1 Tax=Posidoniimonas corsicana TaxID=1938618 RepID=A0A5C5UYE9_9BACT|nr:DUF6666 family protein [Posidoniimonas corsicana]TWT31198.1 hypothetical protein KOR34_45740 [Posidoniimonas corsicana]